MLEIAQLPLSYPATRPSSRPSHPPTTLAAAPVGSALAALLAALLASTAPFGTPRPLPGRGLLSPSTPFLVGQEVGWRGCTLMQGQVHMQVVVATLLAAGEPQTLTFISHCRGAVWLMLLQQLVAQAWGVVTKVGMRVWEGEGPTCMAAGTLT